MLVHMMFQTHNYIYKHTCLLAGELVVMGVLDFGDAVLS